MSEVRESKHGDARLISEPARDPGRLDRDLGEVFGGRHLGDRGIGDHNGPTTRQDHRNPDNPVTRLIVDHAPDLFERDREIARYAGHHGVRIALSNHGGAKVVAILVDHPLTVSQQITLALEPLVQELRIKRIALREPGVVDLNPFIGEIQACPLRRSADTLLPANEDRCAKPLGHERIGGADDLLFLALREHDAFRQPAYALHDSLHGPGDRIPTSGQLRLVSIEIDERAPRDARGHGRLRHRYRHDVHETRVERHRDDVFPAEPGTRAMIRRGNLIRHVFARESGQRVRSRDLHFHIDRLCPDVERAPKNIGKAENVIDLVGVVGPTGGDDDVVAGLPRLFRSNLGVRVRHCKNDRIARHGFDHLRRQRALGGQPKKDVGADHRLVERSERRFDGMGGLPLVHALGAAAIDHALGVAQHHVRRLETNRLDKIETRNAGCSRAIADQTRRVDVATRQVNGIDHARSRDYRCSVLVIVKNRDVHHLAQALFDVKALGSLDVLKIDSAERRTEVFDRADEFVRIFGRDLKVYGVDIGKAFEQDCLSFHDRFRGERSEVAKTQDGCPV